MALRDWFSRWIGRSDRQLTYARMLEGALPVFSQFGRDIYASDIVQMATDCIATEISKLQPRHIRTDSSGMQTMPPTSLNRLLKFGPNRLMTLRDFLERVIWQLYRNYNCFIYPTYELMSDNRGNTWKDYTALYPLSPTQVSYLQDPEGMLLIKMDFASGDSITLPYGDIIHLRKRFSVNSIMGGGLDGKPDNKALLNMLEVNNTVLQGLDKAIRTSLGVRGILKLNTLLDDDKARAEREKFEASINAGKSGILAVDLKGDYIDLKPEPKIIDKDTMEFIQDRILIWFGVPAKILLGTFSDEEYQAFYEKTLEPLIVSLGQAFSRTLFTDGQLSFGNEVVFYHRDVMYLSTKSKLDLIKTAGEQGLLTDNQKLALLGYPPLPDGNRRTISLNYVSVDIADVYQLKKAGAGLKSTTGGGQGDQEG